jgi:hypothetical protein
MQKCNQAALENNFYFYEQHNQNYVAAGTVHGIQ